MQISRSLWDIVRQSIGHAHNILIPIVVTVLAWGIADRAGKDPDITEALWVFFCILGIVFHGGNLSEARKDRHAVSDHPSSNAADVANLDAQIRREILRIVTKSLFLVSGVISLYFPPRFNDTAEVIRVVSIACLMCGVAILDMDAILDKLARRELVRLLILEINSRPSGLSAEVRLERTIETMRDLYHEVINGISPIPALLDEIEATGCLPDDIKVEPMVKRIDLMLDRLRQMYALMRSYDPDAGGPSRTTQTEG
jgi:hypothetical protein